ncbi:uncharacterized protein LOC127594601 [Hippocampus zosterae]|uniref:uncharacterized protein LOC127594601 n=1 Tax=Hippocampus zosterae TaxID=109293 RepID=UPI00223D18C4|nr:uncharacterized protein LOC127594601 [Hippocampus zosterae]
MASMEQQGVSSSSSAATASAPDVCLERRGRCSSLSAATASTPIVCLEWRGRCDTCGGLVTSRRRRRRCRASGEPDGSGDTPARCTVRRRKSRALQDQQLLDANERFTWGSEPREDCLWCGQARTLAGGGHAFHKGSYFCQLNEDCGEDSAVSISTWLQKQLSALPLKTPRTTAWRQHKHQTEGREQSTERKATTCGKCGHPQQAVYGHTSFMSKVPKTVRNFCTLHEGKPMALWLARGLPPQLEVGGEDRSVLDHNHSRACGGQSTLGSDPQTR